LGPVIARLDALCKASAWWMTHRFQELHMPRGAKKANT
jgi:hypothetical protein